jgi:hypothetical protein
MYCIQIPKGKKTEADAGGRGAPYVTIDHLYMSSNEIGSFCEAGGFW